MPRLQKTHKGLLFHFERDVLNLENISVGGKACANVSFQCCSKGKVILSLNRKLQGVRGYFISLFEIESLVYQAGLRPVMQLKMTLNSDPPGFTTQVLRLLVCTTAPTLCGVGN